MPLLNWSHFKPEYSGKPDEDAEAHLLRMNDWMDTHRFPDQGKVWRFCLTYVGEARVWYKLLRLINVDWAGLQNIFRQQYSKKGNTREQLFHAWRSFHFNENAETIDVDVNCIRQVATPLVYQEPQILECFQKHTVHKIILGPLSLNGLKTSGRNSEENINKIKDNWQDILNSINEYKRQFQQKGNFQHGRQCGTEDRTNWQS